VCGFINERNAIYQNIIHGKYCKAGVYGKTTGPAIMGITVVNEVEHKLKKVGTV